MTTEFIYTPARQESAAKLAARNRKLTDDQVREIRTALAAGLRKQTEIARSYGVSDGVVSRIKSGQAWKGTE
jgi:DNA invertase Pin-like site-specific DNA recombinase